MPREVVGNGVDGPFSERVLVVPLYRWRNRPENSSKDSGKMG